MMDLKSAVPDSPLDEILRERYKYISSDGNYYFLADHVNLDGVHFTNWSLHHNIGDDIDDDTPAILSTRSLNEDFDDMIDLEDWESQGYETVVCK